MYEVRSPRLLLLPPPNLRSHPLQGFAIGLLVFDVPVVDSGHVDFGSRDLVSQIVNVVSELLETGFCVSEILDEEFLEWQDSNY